MITANIHKSALRRTALREFGCPTVGGQDIGVAMNFQTLPLLVLPDFKPSTRRKLDHAGPYSITQMCRSKAGTAVIEYPDDVRLLDPAFLCIFRVDPDRFSPFDFGGTAGSHTIQLPMQAGCWLRR